MHSKTQSMRVIFTIICVCALSVLGTAQNWSLVWSDEFTGTGAPDATKWTFDTQGNEWDWGNKELQNYTPASQHNAWLENGSLVIEARKEKYTWPGDNQQRDYTSARLRTINKGDWLYGKVEVRALLPTGKGMWPAIWMLPTDDAYGGWPKSGEIDIMENVGYEPNKIVCTAHSESYNFTIGNQISKNIAVADPHVNWHVYSMEWNANKLDLLIDGAVVLSYPNPKTGSAAWPFDKRFHLLLNVAVGGSWGGQQGVDDAIFPQRMLVDYVRVYEPSAAPVAQTPYKGAVHHIPGIVEAEDFDEGGQQVAYYDDSNDNQGKEYRTGEFVDIGGTPVTGYSVGWFNKNEWMEYTCQVDKKGTYRADVLATTMNANAAGHLEIAGVAQGGTVAVGNTGGWQAWQTFSSNTFTLDAGTYIVRFVCDGQSFNTDKITFTQVAEQIIALDQGWNLISLNVAPDAQIVGGNDIACNVSTLFAGLGLAEIKTMDAFWSAEQPDYLNMLKSVVPGEGYLVKMNAAGTLKLKGTPIAETQNIAVRQGWQLIGCPFQTATPAADVLGSDFSELKDFETYLIPNNTQSNLDLFEPGKGYFLKK